MGGSPTELLSTAIATKKEDVLLRYFRLLRMTMLNVRVVLVGFHLVVMFGYVVRDRIARCD